MSTGCAQDMPSSRLTPASRASISGKISTSFTTLVMTFLNFLCVWKNELPEFVKSGSFIYSRITGAVFLLAAVHLCIMKLHRSFRGMCPRQRALCAREVPCSVTP
jgi:hypothetical protein